METEAGKGPVRFNGGYRSWLEWKGMQKILIRNDYIKKNFQTH